MSTFYFSKSKINVPNWSIIRLTVFIWHLWFFYGLNWAKDIIKTFRDPVSFLKLVRSCTEHGGYSLTSLFLGKSKNTLNEDRSKFDTCDCVSMKSLFAQNRQRIRSACKGKRSFGNKKVWALFWEESCWYYVFNKFYLESLLKSILLSLTFWIISRLMKG